MRALLDTSVLIAYLLNPQGGGPGAAIVNGALAGDFVVLAPRELIDEVIETVGEHAHLTAKISPTALEKLVLALLDIAETIPLITGPIPSVTRDPNPTDDYLVAYALAGRADYLVSYDKDLYTLRRVGSVRIVHPAEFLQVLRSQP